MEDKDIFDRAWEIERILQAAARGDYSQRCDTSITRSFHEDPLATVAPAINLLLNDLQAKERNRQRAEAKLKEAVAELELRLRTIETQTAAIRELSAPVIEAWDDVLVMPLVGTLDTERWSQIIERLLTTATQRQARFAIIDITGVSEIDTRCADNLLRLVRAAKLLGVECVLTGLSPAVARSVVGVGADLSAAQTLQSLKEGLRYCIGAVRGAP